MKIVVKAAFNLNTANLSTKTELFHKNIKYHRLYIDLFPTSEIYSLLRSDFDIEAYILNNFNITYELAEFLESIKNKAECIHYMNLIDPNKVIDAFFKVKENVFKDIVVRLKEKSKKDVFEIFVKTFIKQKKKNRYHRYIASESFFRILPNSTRECVWKHCIKRYKDLDHFRFLCFKHIYH